jgi:hypothetical protein
MPDMSDRMRERYARSEARNEEVRRSLEPLAPGGDDALFSSVAFSVILVVCAVGMWQARYWAVLGFQALLVIQIITATGLLLGATSWWRAFVAFVVLAGGGYLFWKLIRSLARLQMPQRDVGR